MVISHLQISYEQHTIHIPTIETTQHNKYQLISCDSLEYLGYLHLQLHLKPSLLIKAFK